MTAALTAGVPARAALPLAGIAAADDPGHDPLASLPGRPLEQAELMALAAAIAARPERWQGEVAFDDEHRHYACLHRDEHVDVWVLCWTARNDTGWHDHDVSSGAVAVARGRLVEHNLAVGGPEKVTAIDAGLVFSFGPDHIHRLTGAPDATTGTVDARSTGTVDARSTGTVDARSTGTVSVHAYSPPLTRLGQYHVGPDGVLHRSTVSYTEELRS